MTTNAIVTIEKLIVNKSESYGVFGEPGQSAEWEVKFSVAGQSVVRRFDGVRNGSVQMVNEDFEVDIGELDSLNIEATGYEIDDTSANDPLPPASKIFKPADNWEDGKTFTVAASSSNNFSYDLVFKIKAYELGESTSPLTASALPNGQFKLECLGDIPGPKWLDGNTVSGAVALAPDTDGRFTGTQWKAHSLGDNRFTLECMGNVPGPKWLDGNTVNGQVTLAPQTEGAFTGTVWKAHDQGDGRVLLECMGNVPGPKWLDGNTVAGSVSLAPETGGRYTGTAWHIS